MISAELKIKIYSSCLPFRPSPNAAMAPNAIAQQMLNIPTATPAKKITKLIFPPRGCVDCKMPFCNVAQLNLLDRPMHITVVVVMIWFKCDLIMPMLYQKCK